MGSQTKRATTVTTVVVADNPDWSAVGDGSPTLVDALGATSGPALYAESTFDVEGLGHTGTKRLRATGFGFSVPAGVSDLALTAKVFTKRMSGTDPCSIPGSGGISQPRCYDTGSATNFNAYAGSSTMRSTVAKTVAADGGTPETAWTEQTLSTWSNVATFLTIARLNSAGFVFEFGILADVAAAPVPTTVQVYGVELTATWTDPPSGVVASAVGAAHKLLAMGMLKGHHLFTRLVKGLRTSFEAGLIAAYGGAC